MFSYIEINALNIYFLLIGLFVTIMASMAAFSKIRKNKSLYYLLTLIYIMGFSLVIMTNDWFIFLIGWELVTVSTAFMLAWSSKRIARQYFIIQFIGGTILLYVILMAISNGYSIIGPINETWLQNFFIIGLGMKSAIFGLHFWLPPIYANSSPLFAAISSGWVVKLGFITLLKIIPGSNNLLLILGLIMIFYGGIKALFSTNYRVLLSYSSISQLGFISLGIASGTTYGFIGSIIHILAHALAKTNLFLGNSYINEEYQNDSLYSINNIHKRKRYVFWGGVFSLASLMGIVFFAGYYSKYLIKYGFKNGPITLIIMHAASLVTVFYSFRLLWWLGLKEWFEDKKESLDNIQNVLSWNEKIPVFILSLMLLITGVLSNKIINYLGIYSGEIKFHIIQGILQIIVYSIIAVLILKKYKWLKVPEKTLPSMDRFFKKSFKLLYVFSHKTRRFNSDVFFESYLYRFIFGGSRALYHFVYTDFQKQLLWIPVLFSILLFWITLIC